MQSNSNEITSGHWADTVAEELLQKHADKPTLTCASGISPSGMVHIGNFREVITVDFVVRALKERGKNVRFIYSWDDYDALRKIPVNIPQQEEMKNHLRKPLGKIPDPYGTHASYAQHFEKLFEKDLEQLGVSPHYLYQHEQYEKCTYAKGIAHALSHNSEIQEILNRSRTENLAADWTCISIFCKGCGKDITTLKSYTPPYTVHYSCKVCQKEFDLAFDKEPGVKLLWRVDWPMRWAHEGVDFEPGGKDHSSTGGSYETGKQIIEAVYKKEAPHYVQYDFVLAKGLGSKLSSSSGNLITLGEALEIYEPAVLRWIFASRKPNIDFSIAFDLDVMKAYDDFDRCERFAYGLETGEDKKVNYEKRIYSLSVVKPISLSGKNLPYQFGFRHLTSMLQIFQGDLEKTASYYGASIKTEEDKARFVSRASRAWKWITNYAPEEFRFKLRDASMAVKPQFPNAIQDLAAWIKDEWKSDTQEQTIQQAVYDILKKHALEPKVFFPDVYQVLVGKNNGPKLASFLMAIGKERSLELLSL